MLLKPNQLYFISSRSLNTIKTLPVIKVPKYITMKPGKVSKRAVREALEGQKKVKIKRGNRSIPVITCSDQKFNHYFGQTYHTNRDQVALFSKKWKIGQKMVFNSYDDNPAYLVGQNKNKHKIRQVKFNELGLNQDICQVIESMRLEYPSAIQLPVIPEILDGQNIICSAETGSGKTIAYLAPIIQLIKEFKDKNKEQNRFKEPKGLIIVPSRELAEQVGNIARKFGSYCGLGVGIMASGLPSVKDQSLDLVVTTIGLVRPMLNRRVYKINRLRHVVVDEADSLFDDTFSNETFDLLNNINFKDNIIDEDDELESTKEGAQLICVSATMPQNLNETLGKVFDLDNIKRITTESLHHIMPHVRQVFYKLDRKDRHFKLLELIKKDEAKHIATMIFSNRSKSSDWIYHFLRENGIVDCMRLNKNVPDSERLGLFLKFQEGHFDYISCTDLGSRGLDTKRISHVINYDCPHFVSDYIHRAGRTGRMGSDKNCIVSSFVCFKPDNFMVQELEYSLRRGGAIDFVDGNIKSEIKRIKSGSKNVKFRAELERRKEEKEAEE